MHAEGEGDEALREFQVEPEVDLRVRPSGPLEVQPIDLLAVEEFEETFQRLDDAAFRANSDFELRAASAATAIPSVAVERRLQFPHPLDRTHAVLHLRRTEDAADQGRGVPARHRGVRRPDGLRRRSRPQEGQILIAKRCDDRTCTKRSSRIADHRPIFALLRGFELFERHRNEREVEIVHRDLPASIK